MCIGEDTLIGIYSNTLDMMAITIVLSFGLEGGPANRRDMERILHKFNNDK